MKTVLSVIVIIILLMAISMVIKNNKAPKNIGLQNGKLASMPTSPNAVSSQTDIEDKKVEPLKFSGNIDQTKSKVLTVISNYSGATIITNEKDYVYAIFSTGTMKYKDDVEFYFDEKNSLVHFRSASRVGYSDMGLNKKRYEEIRIRYYE